MTSRVTGSCRAPVAASTPPIQKNGIAHRIRADALGARDRADRAGHVDVCRTSVPWVCRTPFGSAVDPEVCTMMARSAGETSASTAASTSSGNAVAAHRPSASPSPDPVAR